MTTDTADIQKIVREYFENVYSNELENLENEQISRYI
jgi:hypothetical protein